MPFPSAHTTDEYKEITGQRKDTVKCSKRAKDMVHKEKDRSNENENFLVHILSLALVNQHLSPSQSYQCRSRLMSPQLDEIVLMLV